MNKIILIFILLFSTSFLYAENYIILTDSQTKKQLCIYTIPEFKAMVDASDNYSKILNAEKESKVKINAVIDKENEEIYISNIVIRYYDKDDVNFKTLYINDRFKINENTDLFYKLKKYYFLASGYSLPVLVILLILFI